MNITKVVLIFVGLPALLCGAYFAHWMYEDWQTTKAYEASVAPIRQSYKDAVEYERLGQESIKKEQAVLQADHDGGATPEETLALFVSALKKKDAQQAAKYYLPWMQGKAKEDMKDWMSDKSLEWFIDAYENGVVKMDESYFASIDMDIYPMGDKYPYSIRMELNKENNIWKILKF